MECRQTHVAIYLGRERQISLSPDRIQEIALMASDELLAAPQPPLNLVVVEAGDGQVELNWDDLATSFDSYTLYVQDNNTSSVVQTITGLGVSTHTVTGLTNDTEYEFWVVSVRGGVESEESNHVTATPEAAAPTDFSLQFNGTDQYVSLPREEITSFPITIEAKVKVSAIPATNSCIYMTEEHDQTAYSGIALRLRSDGKFEGFLGSGSGRSGGDRRSHIGSTVVVAGETYHVAVVFRSMTDSDIYLDGVAESVNVTGTASSIGYAGLRNATMCRDEQFDGSLLFSQVILDEVRIWTEERSSTEINTYKDTTIQSEDWAGDYPNLFRYYRCNDGEGDTLTEHIEQSPAPASAFSLSMDGVNDTVKFGDVLDLGTSDRTVSFFMKMNEVPTGSDFYEVFNKADLNSTANRVQYLAVRGDETIRTFITDNSNNSFTINDSLPVFDTDWHWYVILIDRDGNLELRQDGVVVGTVDISSIAAQDIDSSLPMKIGHTDFAGDTRFANITIDEISIWDKILTDEELNDIKSVILQGDEDGIIGYWNCEDEGASLTDLVASNDGTIDGATYVATERSNGSIEGNVADNMWAEGLIP